MSFNKSDTTTEPKQFNQEVPKAQVKMLSVEQMVDVAYGKSPYPQKRFKSPDDGGVFKLFYPEDLVSPHLSKLLTYAVAESDGLVVGIGKLTKNPHIANTYTISSVSIDPEYQGRGFGRKILERIFKTASENNWRLVSSAYTTEGWTKLKKIIQELAKNYQVDLEDTEERMP